MLAGARCQVSIHVRVLAWHTHRVRSSSGSTGPHRQPTAYQSSTALPGAESTTQCCPQSVTAFTGTKLVEIAPVVDRRLIEVMAVKREPG